MNEMRKCPKCGQEVLEDNLRCFYCGSLLDVSYGPLSFLANSNRRLIAIIIAACLLILFLMWLF